MLYSKFNIYSKKKDSVLIYNTLTGALISIKTELFDDLLVNTQPEVTNPLIDSGILIKQKDDDLKKYKYIQYNGMFKKDRITLYICPTLKCNFSCSYCFEGNRKSGNHMSNEVENAIIEYLNTYKQKKISIIWFGGEPFIEIKRIKSITDKLIKNNITFSSSIITNGSLLTKVDSQILKELHLDFIQISMDGTKTQHDERRYFSKNKGSFDTIISGMEKVLNETSIPITIQVAVDKSNYFGYEDLLLFMNNKFPLFFSKNRIAINYNIVGDRTNFDKKNSCFNHKDYYDYLLHIHSLNIKNKSKLFLPGTSSPCMYKTTDCYAIAPNGDMYKCIEELGNKSKVVGNILNKEVSLLKLADCAFEYDCFCNQECLNCEVFPICGGGCPLDRQKDKGINNMACSFYKKYITEILHLMHTKR